MSGGNTSSAVRQQRAEPHDSLDYFPTPPWATRALCDRLSALQPLHLQECWEPACGEGHMARPLGEYFDRVHASDVHDYSATYPDQRAVRDFLINWNCPPRFEARPPEWVITNPPFRLADQFIWMALQRVSIGCAMLVRTAFLEGQARHRDLFRPLPPAMILQFTERVPMFKGRLDQRGSSATAYCWLVWLVGHDGPTAFDWIAPCRQRFERDADYPPAPAGQAVDGGAPLLGGGA